MAAAHVTAQHGLRFYVDALFTGVRTCLFVLAARQAVPTMHYLREFTATGGLMSYGASVTDA